MFVVADITTKGSKKKRRAGLIDVTEDRSTNPNNNNNNNSNTSVSVALPELHASLDDISTGAMDHKQQKKQAMLSATTKWNMMMDYVSALKKKADAAAAVKEAEKPAEKAALIPDEAAERAQFKLQRKMTLRRQGGGKTTSLLPLPFSPNTISLLGLTMRPASSEEEKLKKEVVKKAMGEYPNLR